MSQKDRDRLKLLHAAQKGLLTQKQAGMQLKLSERSVRKLLARLRQEEDGGILHRLRGRATKRRLHEALREKVVRLVKREYADFRPTLVAEYLAGPHGLKMSKETRRQISDGAGGVEAEAATGGGGARLASPPNLQFLLHRESDFER